MLLSGNPLTQYVMATLMAVLVASACLDGLALFAGEPGNRSELVVGPDADAQQTLTYQWPAPSDEACAEFGVAFEKAALLCDTAGMNDLIDWDALLAKVTRDLEGQSAFLSQFKQEAKTLIASGAGVADELTRAIRQGGSIKFLRTRSRDGYKSVLFRHTFQEPSVNYLEFLLAMSPEGNVRAIDVYAYITAEYMSTTMRRVILPLAMLESSDPMAGDADRDSDFIRNVGKISQMTAHTKAGQFAEALGVYDSLPETVKRDKVFLMLRLQAAPQVGVDEHMQALKDMIRFHPTDPCLDILSIDYFALKQQFEQALVCLERLNKAVGGDPYISVLKGYACVGARDFARAREMFQAAADAEPSLIDAYFGFVDISLAERDFADTARLLTEIGGQFQLQFSELASIPAYADFVQSPEYTVWKAQWDRLQ